MMRNLQTDSKQYLKRNADSSEENMSKLRKFEKEIQKPKVNETQNVPKIELSKLEIIQKNEFRFNGIFLGTTEIECPICMSDMEIQTALELIRKSKSEQKLQLQKKSICIRCKMILNPEQDSMISIECPNCMSDLDVETVLELIREARLKQKLESKRKSDGISDQPIVQKLENEVETSQIKQEKMEEFESIPTESDVKTEPEDPEDPLSNHCWPNDEWEESP